ESYRITINNDNLQNKCTNDGGNIACTASENVSNNLIKLGSFSTMIGKLPGNLTYRIGVVNYTSLIEEPNPTLLKLCVLYYEGKIYSDECSQRRRAICVEDENQRYAVSKLDGSIPRYSQKPISTTGAPTTMTIGENTFLDLLTESCPSRNSSVTEGVVSDLETKPSTLYIIIGAVASGVVILVLVILTCTVSLCRRQTCDAKQSHISVNTEIRSDKTDRLEDCSKDVDSTDRAKISKDHSFCQVKSDIVQYSTPEDAVKFAMTKDTDECAMCTKLDPNTYFNVSKTNMRTSCDANVYQQVNVVVDANVYDTTNYQNEKDIILDPTYDHFTKESNART
ncbi:hypothetical protein CHS0354_006513, partial [Potamilus streckersoni]